MLQDYDKMMDSSGFNEFIKLNAELIIIKMA